jgi:sulfur carrier protein ThiS
LQISTAEQLSIDSLFFLGAQHSKVNAYSTSRRGLPSREKQVVSRQKDALMCTKNTPRYDVPMVSVFLQPEEMKLSLPRPKNVQQLLKALGLRSCTALVAREGELLTQDRAIYPGDQLLVRKVTSSG